MVSCGDFDLWWGANLTWEGPALSHSTSLSLPSTAATTVLSEYLPCTAVQDQQGGRPRREDVMSGNSTCRSPRRSEQQGTQGTSAAHLVCGSACTVALAVSSQQPSGSPGGGPGSEGPVGLPERARVCPHPFLTPKHSIAACALSANKHYLTQSSRHCHG